MKNWLAIVIAAALAFSVPVYARGGFSGGSHGGGFHSSGGFRSSGGFSGGSKSFSSPSISAPKSSGGFSGGSSSRPSTPSTSSVDRTFSRSQSSASYGQFKAASAPPAPPPRQYTYTKTFTSHDDLSRYRGNVYANTYHWSAPSYVYMGHPYYGAWDAMFMWMMLDTNSRFLYNNQHDAGYREWRAEAEKQAETNAELKAKLAKLDGDMQQMQATGVEAKPGDLPEGTTPELALAETNVPVDDRSWFAKHWGITTIGTVSLILLVFWVIW